MPIGKNSLKRVTNNGYSKVASSAPDMENSEVNLVSEAKKHTEEILTPKTEECKSALMRAKEKASEVAAKNKKSEKPDTKEKKTSAAQKAKETVKSMTAEEKKTTKPAAKKAEASVEIKTEEKGSDSAVVQPKTADIEAESSNYVNLGRGKMPYYLL